MESDWVNGLDSTGFDGLAIGVEFNNPLLGTIKDTPGLPNELEPVFVAFDGVFEPDFTRFDAIDELFELFDNFFVFGLGF